MTTDFNVRKRPLTALIISLLIVLILAVYWQVQDHEFIDYDDQLYVTENYRIQSGLTLEAVIATFTDISTSNWHPVTMLSHLLDWNLYGHNAGGHHWTSVIIHILNTVLLFLLLNALTGAVGRSAFVAALFAIHPINVESVAWVAERKNVLSTFFGLLTILFYMQYVKAPHWKRYALLFCSFAFALMSKPMLVTVPFVLLLLDYWPLNRTAVDTRNNYSVVDSLPPLKRQTISFLILEKVPLFILSAISSVVTIYAAGPSRAIAGIEGMSVTARISNAIMAYALYLKKLFWPVDLHIFYPLTTYPAWEIVLAALLLIIITNFVCLYYRKYPYLAVGWFWYLGMLVPVIGIVQVGEQAMADRYAYVPFIGLFVMIAWGANRISDQMIYKKILVVAAVIVILFFTATTFRQIGPWHDTVVLFEDAVNKSPDNYLANNILGKEADKRGDYQRALSYYNQALKLQRNLDTTYNNMGTTFIKMGRRDDAFRCFDAALKNNKFSAEAHYNLGLFYMEVNRLDQSVFYSMKATELRPDFIKAYNNLGVALVKQGRIQEGIVNFEKALKLNPFYKDARRNMQIALALKKKNN